MAAEAGVAAAVLDDPAVSCVVFDEQPETVAARAGVGGSGGRATCVSCISRLDARLSGCGPPESASPGGKAAAKPVTQRVRSLTELKIPPIGANAPQPSGTCSSQPAGPRR